MIVTVKKTASTKSESRYLQRRLAEWLLEEWTLRTEVSGPRASRWMRRLVSLLFAALLVLSLMAAPASSWPAFALVTVLYGLGFGASAIAFSWTAGRSSLLCGSSGPVSSSASVMGWVACRG